MKRTPFYHQIVATGAKMAPVQGWDMPDEYTNACEEHLAVRERVGLGDWSSTGEIEIQGRDALALIQRVIVNDAAAISVGRVLYSTFCKPDGSILSDITIYRLGECRYWVMSAWGSNAANRFPEFEWLKEHSAGLDVYLTDVSSGMALLAVQGPKARDLVSRLSPADLTALKYMHAVEAPLAGAPRALISRTGYTGELGYELVIQAEYAHLLWDDLIAMGAEYGMRLVGLKAAFGLRLEKGYIARFDFLDGVTPFEAGLGWTVKLSKGDFIGREALARQKEQGARRRLVTLLVQGDKAPVGGSAIAKDGAVVGKVTSSGIGYSIGRPIALGLVAAEASNAGTEVVISTDGGPVAALIAPRVLYDAEGKRLRA